MSFILICREDKKDILDKQNIVKELEDNGFPIENIVTLPFAMWPSKADEVWVVPCQEDSKPLSVQFA